MLPDYVSSYITKNESLITSGPSFVEPSRFAERFHQRTFIFHGVGVSKLPLTMCLKSEIVNPKSEIVTYVGQDQAGSR